MDEGIKFNEILLYVIALLIALYIHWKFLQTAVRSGTIEAMRKFKEEEDKKQQKLEKK